MSDKSLLRKGVIGTVIAGACCFTPILVIGLGAVGLSAWLSWLDWVLLPALAISLCVVGYALVRQCKKSSPDTAPETEKGEA